MIMMFCHRSVSLKRINLNEEKNDFLGEDGKP